jgi:hypothetical protein
MNWREIGTTGKFVSLLTRFCSHFGDRTPLEGLLKVAASQPLLVPVAVEFHDAGGDFGHTGTRTAFTLPWLQIQLKLASRLYSWADGKKDLLFLNWINNNSIAATECGPLSRAIIQKDEQRMLQILHHDSTAIQERNSKGQSPMHLSAIWFRGMSILLNYGGQMLIDQADGFDWLPITYAVESHNYDTFQLLMEAGSALSSPGLYDWFWNGHEEVLSRAIEMDDRHLLDLVIDALKSRRVRLFEFAKQSLPTKSWEHLDISDDRVLDRDAEHVQKALEDVGIEIPKALLVTQLVATVFHDTRRYTLKAAQAERLLEAGFKDFDATDDEGLTPLEAYCLEPFSDSKNLGDGLGFLAWLVRKGVDPCRQRRNGNCEDVSSVTGYHLIGHFVGEATAWYIHEDRWALRRNVIDFSNSVDELSLTLVAETIRNGSRDSCHCSCSKGGCSPIIAMLKPRTERLPWGYKRDVHLIPFIRGTWLQWVGCDLVHGEFDMPSAATTDIIRFETFEILGLTHTCCNVGSWRDEDIKAFTQRCEPAEVAEIHEEEQELIKEHEVLVSFFIQAYEERGESLHSFLTGYWRTRMAQVLMERRPLNEEELAKIRRIGVVIKDESNDDRSLLSDNESEAEQDDHPIIHGSEGNLSSEEQISDEAWCRILQEYCDRTYSRDDDWSDE